MNKIKIVLIIFLSLLIIFFISMYISSLNLYKESDFNIPKNFFNTKHFDKYELSKENGFYDLVVFIESLNTKKNSEPIYKRIIENNYLNEDIELQFYALLSKCLFEEKLKNNNGKLNSEQYCEKKYDYYYISKIDKHDKNITVKQRIKKLDKIKYKNIIKYNFILNSKDFDKEISILEKKEKDFNERRPEYYMKSNFTKTIAEYKRYKILRDSDILKLQEVFSITNDDLKLYNQDLKRIDHFKNKIKKQSFRKIKNFIEIKQLKYKKINKKNYILQTSDYINPLNKIIKYTGFFEYSEVIRYVAYNYFKEGKYEKGMDILLNFQIFIDNIIEKGDLNYDSSVSILSINNKNIKTINYFIENYELDNEIKNKIYNSINFNNYTGIINNGIKWIYKEQKGLIDSNILYNKEFNRLKIFYSKKEYYLLNKKHYYDILNNREKSGFVVDLNIYNYIGRVIHNENIKHYYYTYRLEEEMNILKKNLLNKLKK